MMYLKVPIALAPRGNYGASPFIVEGCAQLCDVYGLEIRW